MRQFLVVVAVASAATVTQACSGTKVDDENVGATRSALSGSDDTQDIFNANVVVNLKATGPVGGVTTTALCNGTMISPTRVLTASHCLFGDPPPPTPPAPWLPADIGVVSAGITSGTIVQTSVATSELGHATNANNPDDVDHDLAILNLDESALNADVAEKVRDTPMHDLGQARFSSWAAILETHIERPSLAPPAQATDYSVAAWNTQTQRQIATLPTNLNYQVDFSKAVFTLTLGIGNQMGDSGCPLFWVRSDGSRDPLGVLSGGNLQSGLSYVNLTYPEHAQWLRDQLIDHTHDGLSHVKWRSQHPLPAGETYRWFGEDDYSGPCDPQRDVDCDHWYDEHDNCPLVFNHDQADFDEDGIGDACNGCPCDVFADADGDGVCGAPCATDAKYDHCPAQCANGSGENVDNCPSAYNPDQANCNVDAETITGQAIYGDACDPVPCPETEKEGDGPKSTVKCAGNNESGVICVGRTVYDQFHSTPVGSHRQGASGSSPVFAVNATTDARFCQSKTDVVPAFNCQAASVVTDGEPNFWPDVASEQGSQPAHPWHRITLTGGGFAATRGASTSWTYGTPSSRPIYPPTGTVADMTWDYLTDNGFWLANSKIPPADTNYSTCTNQAYQPGTCLLGVFWMHGVTDIGNGTDHVGSTTVGTHGPNLASKFIPMAPDQVTVYARAGVGIFHFMMLYSTLPDPYGGQRFTYTAIVGQESTGPNIYSMQRDGSGVDLSPLLSLAGKARLADTSLVWASAVEPNENIGRTPSSHVATAISQDGTSIVDSLVDEHGHLTVNADRNIDVTTHPDLVAAEEVPPSPSPRTGFIAFLSRAAGSTFVIGGRNATGTPLSDIWFQRDGSTDWSFLTPTTALGEVKAATYTFSDNRLWIVDEIQSNDRWHHHNVVRLLRVDPTRGATKIFAEWPAELAARDFYLSVDRDGSVLLTAAGRETSTTFRLVMRDQDRLDLDGVHVELGRLQVRPVVDDHAYSFVTLARDGSSRIHRIDSLSDGQRRFPFADLDGLCHWF